VLIRILKECKVRPKGKEEKVRVQPGQIVDLPEGQGKSVINAEYGEEAETEEVPDMTETGEVEELGEVEEDEEKTEKAEDKISPNQINLLHKRYQDVWGDDYDVEKEAYLEKKFDKEHTDSLTAEEAGEAIDDLEKRLNEKEVEEKAESEVEVREREASSGEGQVQILKQSQAKEEEGISVDKAREQAKEMANPEMVQKFIEDMDFAELGEYIWDPEEEKGLPYDSLEPKVDLYEAVLPLWEMFTGWSYNIMDFDFNKNEEDDVYECTITIVREGGPSDPTTIRFTKTKKKENLMKRSELKEGMEKEQWKEFMESLAFKRAMRPQMRLWVDKFVRAYKKTKGR